MNEELFAELTSQIKVGKQLPDAIYLHKDAFSALPKVLTQFIPAVAKAVNLDEKDWNLVKLFKKSSVYLFFITLIFIQIPIPH